MTGRRRAGAGVAGLRGGLRGGLSACARTLAREDGTALMAGIAMLAVTLGLATVVAGTSTQLSHTANQDRSSKRALGAAEAGLQAAAFHANKLAPAEGSCVSGGVAAPEIETSTGTWLCAGHSEELGNGARYTYWVSTNLDGGATCAGLPLHIDPNPEVTIVQRCVTAVGEAHGVKRRAQARVAAFRGVPIFPLGGMISLGGIELGNSTTVDGKMGANQLVDIGNSSETGDIEIAFPAPNPSVGGSSSVGDITRRTEAEGPFVLAGIDFGNSATVNDNGRISGGQDASTGTTYDAGARTLTMSHNGSLTLGGATYNFCNLSLGNNAKITVASGAKVRLFIDSPDREGSGCAAGTGHFTMGQGTDLLNPSGDPLALQIYIYGFDDGSHTVEFNNSANAKIHSAIFAPQSKLVFNNQATIAGGLAAAGLEFNNSLDFTWTPELADLRARTAVAYYRTAWRECPKEPSDPDDPASGC